MKDTCAHFIAAYLPLSLTAAIPMAESDASISDHDSESSVSESLGIRTLQARSMVLASFRNPLETEFGILLQYLRPPQNAREHPAAPKSSPP
jgi:hypothetical protein